MLDNLAETTIDETGAPAAPVVSQVKCKGIAIVGSHPATVEQAPFDRPEWAIWACSPHNVEKRKLPRVDQWFEVHDPIEDPTRAFSYLKAVSEMPFVWMRDQRALKCGDFKGAREYPEKELFGTWSKRKAVVPNGDGTGTVKVARVPNVDGLFCPWMITSSIALMQAKAIVECERHGIPEMGLWGIMQMSENEYSYQKPGIQYFIWEAIKRGIRVNAPGMSCLFDMPEWKW